MKHQLVILFIIALTGFASAQSTAFTYQGHLMDAGASANGNYDLQFTLKSALMDGATAAQFLFCKSGDQVWGGSTGFMLR